VLEHLAQPRAFLQMVRQALGTRRNTVVFFEVPNGLCTLRDLAIWDIIYEHCAYFSPSSLARLFVACGFDICALRETFAGQFLCLEAWPAAAETGTPPTGVVSAQDLAQEARSFAARFQRKKARWEERLAHLEAHGQRCVVWGAGSKGVTFLRAYRPDVVLLMNPLYRHEVQQRLDSLGVKAALMTA
jgi:hypothetical protein